MTEKTVLVCEKCNGIPEDLDQVRRFIGNVNIGKSGGVIGNNFPEVPVKEKDNFLIFDVSKTKEFKVKIVDYCNPCASKILFKGEDK